MSPREFHVHSVPPAREELWMGYVRDGESVVQRRPAVETKRVLVGIGEESDESRERVSEVANRRWDGESVIIRPTKDLGMYVMSDDSGMSDVDWNHGFLHGSVEHDLSRLRVTKDIKFYAFIKVSTKAVGLN